MFSFVWMLSMAVVIRKLFVNCLPNVFHSFDETRIGRRIGWKRSLPMTTRLLKTNPLFLQQYFIIIIFNWTWTWTFVMTNPYLCPFLSLSDWSFVQIFFSHLIFSWIFGCENGCRCRLRCRRAMFNGKSI